MLHFFCQIRQRFLTDNPPAGSRRADRLSKYLLYAIGEIVLVVVGILIALQVNNRNEYQKDGKSQQLILSEIPDNFKYDLNSQS